MCAHIQCFSYQGRGNDAIFLLQIITKKRPITGVCHPQKKIGGIWLFAFCF